jgi:hypothetical protein
MKSGKFVITRFGDQVVCANPLELDHNHRARRPILDDFSATAA